MLSAKLNWTKGSSSMKIGFVFVLMCLQQIDADEGFTIGGEGFVGGGVRMMIPSGICGNGAVSNVRN